MTESFPGFFRAETGDCYGSEVGAPIAGHPEKGSALVGFGSRRQGGNR